MMKSIAKIFGITSLLCVSIFAVWYLEAVPRDRLLAITGWGAVLGEPSPSPTPPTTPVASPVPPKTATLGVVSVQTFSGSRLMRSGGGAAVSSDGLIITTSAVAPFGSGSFTYQVHTSSGEVFRARRVAFDAPTGLVLLVAPEASLNAISFSDVPVRSGDRLSAISAFIDISTFTEAVVPLSVVYTLERGDMYVAIDRDFMPITLGAQVKNANGEVVGVMLGGSPPRVISSALVNTFVERYLATTEKAQ